MNNKEGGYIRGLELAYTQIYSGLPGMLSGLGSTWAIYTERRSKTSQICGGSVPQALPGLSENVVSATVFWAYEGFETRLSARYRDAFVKQVAVNEQIVNFASETVLDYQASYNSMRISNVVPRIISQMNPPWAISAPRQLLHNPILGRHIHGIHLLTVGAVEGE